MITRLKVSGFKNLVDVDVAFGPFTCIAGANAAGKSNLFDSIYFLSRLAEVSLQEAAASVRAGGKATGDPTSLFTRVASGRIPEMYFEVEMIIPKKGVDDFGQPGRASTTLLRYQLRLGLRESSGLTKGGPLRVLHESLNRIKHQDFSSTIGFPHARTWRDSVLHGQKRSALISTAIRDGKTVVQIHQDQRQGRVRRLLADQLPRTALSSADAAETPTALLARAEMLAWREMQLEPSALREPDSIRTIPEFAPDGSHLPATVAYLTGQADTASDGGGENYLAELSNRLSLLIRNVRSLRIDRDEARETLTLMLTDGLGCEHPARALSDGTLRFLALAVVESDPRLGGVICLEEPENGIHPDRIRPMLRLLRDIAVDVGHAVGEDNPLRQVIVNTHSPTVVSEVRDDELLVAQAVLMGQGSSGVVFRWLPDTWRVGYHDPVPTLSRGALLAYLSPLEPEEVGTDAPEYRPKVKDRPDFQQIPLPLNG